MAQLQELLKQIEAKTTEVKGLYDQIGDTEPSREQYKQVVDLNKEIEDLEHQAADAKEWQDVRAVNDARAAEFKKAIRKVGHDVSTEDGDGSRKSDAEIKGTLGDRFLADPQFKSWFEQAAPQGKFSERQRVQSPPIQFKTLVTGLGNTQGGALVTSDMRALVNLPFRPLTIRDLVTNGTTNSDTVEYPRVTGYTNNAAPVIEATATSGSSGTKPESALALERVTETVKTIAHWIPATKRALADAGQMRTLIDNFLMYGLEEELEDQMITGDGTGENFTGILNVSGTTAQAWDTDLLTTTRKARTKVRTTGRANPTGYVLNPTDWEALDLLQDNEARYYFGGPSVMGTPRLWGLPVVESEAMTSGTGIVGDLRQMVLWDREQASITVSDSHSDFFIRNMVVILGEGRYAFGVLRPAAIVEMDLTA